MCKWDWDECLTARRTRGIGAREGRNGRESRKKEKKQKEAMFGVC
jgi:hypothetical protein